MQLLKCFWDIYALLFITISVVYLVKIAEQIENSILLSSIVGIDFNNEESL